MNPRIYVSYSQYSSRRGLSSDDLFVYNLCKSLQSENLHLSCDLYSSIHRNTDELSSFPICSSSLVIAVISAESLKSRWAMLRELFDLFAHFSFDPNPFDKSLCTVFLDSAEKLISKSSSDTTLDKYWREQLGSLQLFLRNTDPDKEYLPNEWQVADDIERLIQHLPTFITSLQSSRVPAGPDLISANGYAGLKKYISRSKNASMQQFISLESNNSISSLMTETLPNRDEVISSTSSRNEHVLPTRPPLKRVLTQVAYSSHQIIKKKDVVCYCQEVYENTDINLVVFPPDDIREESLGGDSRIKWDTPGTWFLLGQTPVTHSQWKAVSKLPRVKLDLRETPGRFCGTGKDDHPVECISWYEAIEFCNRLSTKFHINYRLPSQAEWEHACRANSSKKYAWGNWLDHQWANFRKPFDSRTLAYGTTAVKKYPANPWGLYDMHGNVWEWCSDKFDILSYYSLDSLMPSTRDLESNAVYRVIRGGSWAYDATFCSSSFVGQEKPDYRCDNIGFRVAASIILN